jgi:hypothetical protein
MYFFTSDMIYAIREQLIEWFHRHILAKQPHEKFDECL